MLDDHYANKLRNVNDWRMAFFNADADVVAVNRVQVILNSNLFLTLNLSIRLSI